MCGVVVVKVFELIEVVISGILGVLESDYVCVGKGLVVDEVLLKFCFDIYVVDGVLCEDVCI